MERSPVYITDMQRSMNQQNILHNLQVGVIEKELHATGAILAYDALTEEVKTSPKPGLVDSIDSGAHRDMNINTFMRSADAVAPYLGIMLIQGFIVPTDGGILFREIQKTGIAAERAMYEATGGVNTHKGAIFTLGLLMAAAGSSLRTGRPVSRDLFNRVRELFGGPIGSEIEAALGREPVTFGEKLIHRGNPGIRGEAASGFPAITETGLPALCEARAAGAGTEDAKLHVLLNLMANLNDTCVIRRGGYAGSEWLKERALQILAETEIGSAERRRALAEMNSECIKRNISPGGAADLLAATLLADSLGAEALERSGEPG